MENTLKPPMTPRLNLKKPPMTPRVNPMKLSLPKITNSSIMSNLETFSKNSARENSEGLCSTGTSKDLMKSSYSSASTTTSLTPRYMSTTSNFDKKKATIVIPTDESHSPTKKRTTPLKCTYKSASPRRNLPQFNNIKETKNIHNKCMNASGLYKGIGYELVWQKEAPIPPVPTYEEIAYGPLETKKPCGLPSLMDENYNQDKSFRHHLSNINDEQHQ